jgi:hypothetical protein
MVQGWSLLYTTHPGRGTLCCAVLPFYIKEGKNSSEEAHPSAGQCLIDCSVMGLVKYDMTVRGANSILPCRSCLAGFHPRSGLSVLCWSTVIIVMLICTR